MLAIFEPQLTNIDSELLTLQSRLAELKKIKKDLETKQSKASEALESLKAVTCDLAGEAIDNLKAAVLAIFPSNDTPGDTGNDGVESTPPISPAPQTEFMVEIPQKLPTEEEIFDAECLPQPEQPQQNLLAELVTLNSTVAYQRQHDGEIICAYLGCSTQKLAKDWAETLTLKGHTCERPRKAKRLNGEGIAWELKICQIAISALEKLANVHGSPNSPVPSPYDGQKKPESPAPTPPSNDSSGTGESSAATGNDDSSESSQESSYLATRDKALHDKTKA